MTDHDMAGAEPLGHDLGGEGLGAQRGQRLVEGNDEGLIEAERLQQLELQRQRRQPEEGRVRREELARMRLEHDRTRAAAFLSGDRDRRVEHFLVAAMDAVEIADGKRRALEVGRHVLPAADNVHHGTFDLALLTRRAAVDHHHGFTLEHGLAVDGAVASQRRACLLDIEAGDLQRGDHLVADIDRAR